MSQTGTHQYRHYATGSLNRGNKHTRDRTWSPARGSSLWEDCPVAAMLHDPSVGIFYRENFRPFVKATDGWVLTQAASGTGVASADLGGGVTLDSGATTDGQGPQIQQAGVFLRPAAGKHIWFETSVKASHITGDFFWGLAEIDTTLVATSALTTSNHIGWYSVTGNGIMLAAAAKAGTAVASLAHTTLVADTYVKLGFKVNGVTSIEWYLNGAKHATTYATANIPVLGLTPSFTVHATGTDQAVLNVKWVQAAQIF